MISHHPSLKWLIRYQKRFIFAERWSKTIFSFSCCKVIISWKENASWYSHRSYNSNNLSSASNSSRYVKIVQVYLSNKRLNNDIGYQRSQYSSSCICRIALWIASYAIHEDKKFHTAFLITLKHEIVYAHSSKQKVVVKSSTESEFISVSDSASPVIWSQNYLIEQGYSQLPAIIYQDETSTI
jgi:hypothetical protein